MEKIYLYIIVILGIIYLFKNYYQTDNTFILKDFMDGEEKTYDNCESRPVNSDYKKAWTDEHVSKNVKYHTSKITDEKTNPGEFFNKNNEFVDSTTSISKNIITDKCVYEDGLLKCEFNDKLQNIPPSLIENPETNPLLLSIGDDKNINTNKLSSEIFSFNGNNYNVWEYGDESSNGYSNDSAPLKIDGIKKNYTL